jgi:hypothetical protein
MAIKPKPEQAFSTEPLVILQSAKVINTTTMISGSLSPRQVGPCHHDKSVPVTTISRSPSPRHGASSGCGWRNGLRIWRVAANMKSPTADKGWSSSLGVGRGANNSSP